MGNFLIVCAGKEKHLEAERRFNSGIGLASALKGQKPGASLHHGGTWAACFPRQNGSGGTICSDRESGDWLLSNGTWVHADGFGVGNEIQLLKHIREEGLERVSRNLEGFFTIVYGRSAESQFAVLTDIVGSCHSFMRSWEDTIAISSSSLLLAAMDDAEIDPISFQEFVCGGVIYQDRTLFCEVKKLEPAACLQFHEGRLAKRTLYWKATDLAPESLDGAKAIRAVKDSILGVAGKLKSAFRNPVCDLTGGYDSRLIVAGFLARGLPFSTVVSGKPSSPDAMVSAALASLKGLPHQRVDPEPISSYDQIARALQLTDGECDAVEYARTQQIHTELSRAFEISINGSFGEIARGYWWEILFPHAGKAVKVDGKHLARMRYVPREYDPNLIPKAQRLDFVSHMGTIFDQTNRGLESLPNTFQLDHAYLRMRMHRWQGRIATSTNQIWPCLSPFMFRSVLEAMLQVKSRMRRRSLLVRDLLPELDAPMSEYPLEHGFPPLRVKLTNLHRFWPIIPMYAGKVKSRVRRTGNSHAVSEHDMARLSLWNDPRVREALRADRFLSVSLFDASALAGFLRSSESEQFAYSKQWARILTLECALRALHEAKRTTQDELGIS
jgi:hypothetical protein